MYKEKQIPVDFFFHVKPDLSSDWSVGDAILPLHVPFHFFLGLCLLKYILIFYLDNFKIEIYGTSLIHFSLVVVSFKIVTYVFF